MNKPQIIIVGSLKLEVKEGEALISPSDPKKPGAPVSVSLSRLESLLKRLYKEELFK